MEEVVDPEVGQSKAEGSDKYEWSEKLTWTVVADTARRRNLDARIDAIIKKPKSKGGSRKKRGGQQDDVRVLARMSALRTLIPPPSRTSRR